MEISIEDLRNKDLFNTISETPDKTNIINIDDTDDTNIDIDDTIDDTNIDIDDTNIDIDDTIDDTNIDDTIDDTNTDDIYDKIIPKKHGRRLITKAHVGRYIKIDSNGHIEIDGTPLQTRIDDHKNMTGKIVDVTRLFFTICKRGTEKLPAVHDDTTVQFFKIVNPIIHAGDHKNWIL